MKFTLLLLAVSWTAIQAGGNPPWDPSRVAELRKGQDKGQVQALFGKPGSKAPLKIPTTGCVELWVWTRDDPADGVALSEREREVVRLIANGYTNPEIAEQLNVAERTVKTYRARAIEKLGFSSRAEITAYVRRTGLAD